MLCHVFWSQVECKSVCFILLEKVEYAKRIPQLKTHSKQKELERVWELITKDPEWAVALRKRKIA